ncbi:hypothetical protein [Methylobacterium durans]|uniref:hypothetical protein n=1 Tax=Methylobacterium durans TaxID=2202825 RepID=UPI0013A5B373|nr:hypothetical protein [Methylobacterium durans]
MSMDRLTKARQSGKSDLDLKLHADQVARQQAEQDEAIQQLDDKISYLKALRQARDAEKRA